LRAAVAAANRFVLDVARAVPSRRGMGTTLSALVLIQDQGFIAQVGDSRIYRLREEAIEQLTIDHTWVEDMVRGGVMQREIAETHPNRHMLTRAIGTENDAEPDVFTFSLREGDVYLICSDGMTNHGPDEDLAKIMNENTPGDSAWKLVGAALVGGGSDNTTCIIVRVDTLENV
jgi:PPM family protein phosphatase